MSRVDILVKLKEEIDSELIKLDKQIESYPSISDKFKIYKECYAHIKYLIDTKISSYPFEQDTEPLGEIILKYHKGLGWKVSYKKGE